MIKKILIVTIIALFAPSLVQARWNADWPLRKKIAINPIGVSTELTQVPVMLRLHSGNFDFINANPDGSDLRFVAADDKTELKFHLEKYDALNELAIVWILLPKIGPAEKDGHLWLYYGNVNANKSIDNREIWDSSTVAVWQFNGDAPLRDATKNGLTFTGQVAIHKTALLGDSAIFNGEPITFTPAPDMKLVSEGGFTFSAWIKPVALPQQATLYEQGHNLSLILDEQKLRLIVGNKIVVGGEIKPGVWQHIAVTVGAGSATLYLNGAVVGNGNAELANAETTVSIGKGYNGELDELEIANSVRSHDWIALESSEQGANGQLLLVQSDDNGSNTKQENSGYIGVLFHSLTTDGWAIIVVLAFMFIISAVVMLTKVRLVLRTERDNSGFLRRFRVENDDLLALDEKITNPDSSLFRLYQAGIREVRKRYVNNSELSLSGASIDAIKAAIDAEMVLEIDALNDKMVLLTIAISGGPFIGLLGTVVGVMITFAAIAAAGDVNVNAISPGIAAALLATVAGLAVAIPSLFGYNYLASRIRKIISHMQIFVDEFITRVAELYGR